MPEHPSDPTKHDPTEGALSGTTVLEYSQMIAGPYCAKLLADLGAEVIKIEEPPAGDPARHRGPFPSDVTHPEKSGLFLYANTNKLGVTLDPRTPTGRELFQRLAADADILIEDRPPGEMTELGLDYGSLSALNPDLIVTSITPYGQTGPYRDHASYHLNLYHATGHSSFFYIAPEMPGAPPVVGGSHIGDYDAGLTAAIATLAALFARQTTGEGQHIDVSRFDTLVGLERVEVARWANDPIPDPYPGMVGGLMPCQDGQVVVIAVQDHEWQALVELMDNPAWAQEEMCHNEATRAQNRDKIQPLLEEWMLQHDKEDIYHRGQALSVPVAPVRTAAEVSHWTQTRERGFFAELEHPYAGKLEYPTAGYKLSETPWQGQRPAPLLGQHNEVIYCDRLGYSREELAELAANGII
jgi:crotonobetainyl-CoA:carnitine CoA-transferase CaiB-like acyl-CoA transferase